MSGCDATPEVKTILRGMAKELVGAGYHDPNDILDRIHSSIQEHTPLYKSEIADIISGYGDVRKPSRDELQIRMNALKRQLRDISRGQSAKDQTRQKDLNKQISELERRIVSGDFSKPVKTPIVYNDATNRLMAERNALRKKADNLAALAEYKNSSTADKVASTFLSFRRAIMLSSVKTLAKLSAAASYRVALSPIEHGIQGVLGKLPGIRGIAEKAPLEGRFSPAAEGAALKTTFSKATLDEMKDKLTKGFGERDQLYGKEHAALHPLLEMVGQAHAALKTPAERNAFARGQQMATEFEMKKAIESGMAPHEVVAHMESPVTQGVINMRAYEASKLAILKNDNLLVTSFRRAQQYLESKGAGGKSISNALTYAFPIVAVPTNFVAEGTSYAGGGLKAAARLIMSKGVRNLTEDQADYVMRNLGKQTIGAMVGAMGWYGYQQVGSFYQEGDNKRTDIPEAESAFGLPKWALDTPLGLMLSFGATLHRVSDGIPTKHGKNEVGTGTLADGVYAASAGMLDQVPFLSEPARLGRELSSAESASKFVGKELATSFVPPDIRHIAIAQDGDTPRTPQGFTDELKMSIPGLRSQVPATDQMGRRQKSRMAQ